MYLLKIYCSFCPRYCFEYLAIHRKRYINKMFQCRMCIVSSGGISKPVVLMISSKDSGLGSQPEILTSWALDRNPPMARLFEWSIHYIGWTRRTFVQCIIIALANQITRYKQKWNLKISKSHRTRFSYCIFLYFIYKSLYFRLNTSVR